METDAWEVLPEFLCERCHRPVVAGECTGCSARYGLFCPQCGNALVFEVHSVAGVSAPRCTVCRNAGDLELRCTVSGNDGGPAAHR